MRVGERGGAPSRGGGGFRRAWVEPASPRSLPLWFGVLGPPLAWATQLVLGDLIFELGCAPGVTGQRLFGLSLETWALAQATGMAMVALLAGIAAAAAFRRLRGEREDTAVQRARGMALAGMASSALFLAIIAYGLLPPLFLGQCAPQA